MTYAMMRSPRVRAKVLPSLEPCPIFELGSTMPLRCHPVATVISDQLSEHTFKLLAPKSLRRGHKDATPAKAAIMAVGGRNRNAGPLSDCRRLRDEQSLHHAVGAA